MPAGVITIDRDDVIIQASTPVFEHAPLLAPGVNIRAALERLTHIEMIDRLMIRREVATFPGTPGKREFHWMLWGERNEHGEQVMTFWETDWNEVMNERRAAFTMAASHELRGPLTTLLGFAEILNMNTGNLTPEQVEAAAIVEATARHLSVLVEDVFDLSRNSFGELRLNLCDTDLEEVVQSVVSTARPRITGRGQSLECVIESPLPVIKADQARATQMITNLVNNASIHNPEDVTIRIHARVESGYVIVSVDDNGVGLPFNDPEEAFRTFRRGDESTAGDRTGSGIGLSITKRLIQLHRGNIEVESSPGAGTKFTLWFPVDRGLATAASQPGPA